VVEQTVDRPPFVVDHNHRKVAGKADKAVGIRQTVGIVVVVVPVVEIVVAFAGLAVAGRRRR